MVTTWNQVLRNIVFFRYNFENNQNKFITWGPLLCLRVMCRYSVKAIVHGMNIVQMKKTIIICFKHINPAQNATQHMANETPCDCVN